MVLNFEKNFFKVTDLLLLIKQYFLEYRGTCDFFFFQFSFYEVYDTLLSLDTCVQKLLECPDKHSTCLSASIKY